MRFILWITALWIAVPAIGQTATEPCHVDDLETAVQCGTLDVPLDYDAPEADTISVGFVVLPGFNPAGEEPPLVFLAGGPGQSATGLAAQVNRMLDSVRATRDIVLIDQRGTGRSAAFECDADADIDLAAPEDLLDTELLDVCIDQLPPGVAHFNTANAIRDFELVREHLGYEKVDLYGGSYGSRAAFAYLAIAGESVRSVVLDGIAPPSIPIGLFGQSAAAAYELALSRCAAIEDCHSAFPNLRADFLRVGAQLHDGPFEAEIPHPTTGQPTPFRLWHGHFISLVRVLLYSPSSVALLPAVVTEAANGNYRPLASLMASVSSTMGINTLLNLNIVCNEDYSRFTRAAIEADGDNRFGGNTSYRLWALACERMPAFPVDSGWMEARTFSQPALLLSGKADPVTPPGNGDVAMTYFSDSRHVVVDNAAHIVTSSDCGGEMIAAFLEQQDPEAIDISCRDELPGQRYVLDTMGSLSTSAAGEAP